MISADPQPPLVVALLADDPLVRAGLASLLDDEGWIVVDAAEIQPGASPTDADPEADVWLLDLGPDEGPEGGPGDLPSDAPTVALAADPAAARRALAAGVAGVVERDAGAGTLRAALRAVVAGLEVRSPVFRDEPAELAAAPGEPPPQLTPREREVLELVARGLANKGVARALEISESTVKFHLASLLSKLGAANRTELVTRALRLGLLPI